jgi:hypothetical protein
VSDFGGDKGFAEQMTSRETRGTPEEPEAEKESGKLDEQQLITEMACVEQHYIDEIERCCCYSMGRIEYKIKQSLLGDVADPAAFG